MINHARTLLLNRDGNKRPGSSFFLEEYVPTAYKPVKLTGALQSVRAILFGSNPDDAFMNYRLHQFMKILHSNEYVEYVTALDSRISYLPGRSVVDERWSATTAPMSAGGYDSTLDLLGDFKAAESECRLDYICEVSIPSTGVVDVVNKTTGAKLETTYTITEGLSNEIPLQGVPAASFKLHGNPTVTASWLVNIRKEANADLANLPAKLQKSTVLWTTLFTGDEPYATFRKLWENHAYLDYRLSGVLLALIYRTEAIRTNA